MNEGSDLGNSCQWRRESDLVDLAVFVANANGLSGIYRFEERNEYFEPTEVAGHPAVFTGVLDSRDAGFCDLWVGVNDEEVLHISAVVGSTGEPALSCDLTADVADAALATLGA